ncbi:MAG: hydroxymethylbilane synthase [Proteobacteria bacterium]|nr:MAG: hydroxymethylbilane synthase [Pseudomonadota bacterium]
MSSHPHTKARIATRGSQLALWQANYVSGLLQNQGLQVELNVIKTTGDRVQDRFLHEMGGKGLFVRELEEALRSDEADLAVHSLKDLPAKIPAGFELPAILKRHIPNDVIIFHPSKGYMEKLSKSTAISKEEMKNLGSLTIATASLRRQSLLRGLKSGIKMIAVRGNVDTRIRKLGESDWDALILAGASLERLGLTDLPHKMIDLNWFIPCAAQGALAIETTDTSTLRPVIATLKDPRTFACATLERKVLEYLGGDCTMPFGAFVHFDESQKKTKAAVVVLDYEGDEVRIEHTFTDAPEKLNIETAAKAVIHSLEAAGVADILKRIEGDPPPMGEIF